jgi:hypothetical protein
MGGARASVRGQPQRNKYYVLTTRSHGGECARIHVADCGFCNGGRGAIYGDAKVRGTWRGPYDYDEAFRVALELALSDTRHCQRCMRSVAPKQ